MLLSGATPMLFIVPDSLNSHKSHACTCKRLFQFISLHFFCLLKNPVYLN